MTHWLDIVGVGEAGVESLPTDTLALLERAEVIIGVGRRLGGFDKAAKEIVEWDGNLNQMVAKIMKAQHRKTVLLASGDPNWFGIASTLSRRLSAEEFAIHPVPSSFQLAAARLHWPLQNVQTLSLHGRPVQNLHPHVLPANRILALTSDASTLGKIADLLVARGYGRSRLTVLENLGSSDEKIRSFPAAGAGDVEIGDFYVLAVDCVADADAPLLPPLPGLPDEAFVSDGQLTKREVRAATLAKLAPYPEALLWDVGAGCGSVGIEWMRAARNARSIAFERDAKRCDMIAANKLTLGVPALEIIEGEAPETLLGRPSPDAIFLGGAVADAALFDVCWQSLRPGGRLVANAVTLDGEQALYARQARLGGELARIEISVLDRIGSERVLRPRMAVTQWLAVKGDGK